MRGFYAGISKRLEAEAARRAAAEEATRRGRRARGRRATTEEATGRGATAAAAMAAGLVTLARRRRSDAGTVDSTVSGTTHDAD